ncbi:MAG: nuclear transport factor 2 family protein [Rhodoblastus sp.]|nr:nuclear transport factor 2 family protein [Rhodoblastus sp.]
MNRISKAFAAICIVVLATSYAGADQKEDVVRLYLDFVSAQNARDLAGVRRLLSDSPDFLWVSDGRPVWGADAMVRRMSAFQASDVWRVEPALDRARAVSLSSDVAFLHLPLTLEIGAQAKIDRLRFLVGMVAKRTSAGWRIAALFTTGDKSAP